MRRLFVDQNGFGAVGRYLGFDACVAGNAVINATPSQRHEMLDRLQECDVETVRFLHVAKDDRDPDRISEYQPTYAEWEQGFDFLEPWLDEMGQRDMGAWLTIHHRQRLTRSEAEQLQTPGLIDVLFGPRPSQILKGEIHDLFFWFPELQRIVASKARVFAKRFAAHRALRLVSCANEKWGVRGRNYAMNERNAAGASAYNRAFFTLLDLYLAITRLTEKDMTAAGLEAFRAWVGYMTYSGLRTQLRGDGILCPINASAIFGDTRMSALAESMACDFEDVHAYASAPAGLPDPFLPNEIRSMSSIARACRNGARPLACSEYAGVNEGKKIWAESKYAACDAVAEAGFDLSTYYAAWLGVIGRGGIYNGFDDPELVKKFVEAAKKNRTAPRPSEARHQLTREEMWGYKPAGAPYVPPAIPGTQDWARGSSVPTTSVEATGVGNGEFGGVLLPPVPWLAV